MNHGSLFSGGGGFDLASEWIGWENVFNCEINPFCRKILNYYWPNVISYEDITRTDFTIWKGKIDILSGGFPCQGFSVAGLRKGTEDHRFLWPEMRRAYQESKPTWVVCENVTGLLTMEDGREISKDVFFKVENSQVVRLQEVDLYSAIYIRQAKMLIESICQDFEKDGYEVQTFNIPSASVEAPHKRERVWIIAYNTNTEDESMREQENSAYGYKPATNPESIRHEGARETRRREPRSENSNIRVAPDSGSRRTGMEEQNTSNKGQFTSDTSKSKVLRQGNGALNAKRTSEFSESKNAPNPNNPGLQEGQLDGSEVQGSNRKGGDSSINKSKVKECGDASDTISSKRSERRVLPGEQSKTGVDFGKRNSQNNQGGTWKDFPTQSPICSGDDGLSGRLDGITFSNWRSESIKMFGNAVVPDIPYEFFKIIDQI